MWVKFVQNMSKKEKLLFKKYVLQYFSGCFTINLIMESKKMGKDELK